MQSARATARQQILNEKLKKIEVNILNSHKEEKRKEEAKAVSAIKTNSKYFFNYAKKKQKVKARIGPLENEDGTWSTSNHDVAEKLRIQYEKSFSTPLQDKIITNPTEFFETRENESRTESINNY